MTIAEASLRSDRNRRGPRRVAEMAATFAAYLALAVLATWPLAARAGDHVFGHATPHLNVWAMGWVLHQLPRDPLRLFDGNAFYPYGDSLAFSEHLFVPALLAAPVVAATGNLVLAHNLVALFTLAGSGMAMYLLARELVEDELGAFAAGVLYAFHTWNVNELIRLQILSNQWFPLLLWALVRFFRTGSVRWGAAAGLFYALQSLSCMYWALYAPLLVVPAVLVLQRRARRPLGDMRHLIAPLLVAVCLAGVFFLPYARTSRELGFARGAPESVPLDRYFDVLPGNLLYEEMLGTARANQNAAHFLGFSALGLATAGAISARGRWPRLRLVLPLLILYMVAGVLLSAGPEIWLAGSRMFPGPYSVLRELVPGFQNVRYPERFSLAVVLGLAPLVAAGVARVRARLGVSVAVALCLLLYLEHFSAPLPLVPLPTGEAIPSVYRWLAERDDVRVVAEVPEAPLLMERVGALPMYFSTVHWKRTLQGFTGYFPPAYPYVRWRLFHFPAEESVAMLEQLGVDTVVVRPESLKRFASGPRWTVVGPFSEGHQVLRLHRVGPSPTTDPPDNRQGLAELSPEASRVTASVPGARAAVDGDLRTAWTTTDAPRPWDFIRVELPGPAMVSRVSIAVGPPYEFPTGGVRLIGEPPGASPRELAHDEATAYERLLAGLLHHPRQARLDLDIAPTCLSAVRLRVKEVDAFQMPWRVSELRLLGPRVAPATCPGRASVALPSGRTSDQALGAQEPFDLLGGYPVPTRVPMVVGLMVRAAENGVSVPQGRRQIKKREAKVPGHARELLHNRPAVPLPIVEAVPH